ncbi:MAG: Ig-like domain-containing protein, partial [Pirellulales bacterium]
ESSDTGIPDDDITSKMSPAFDGVAEKNSRIRLFATNVATSTTQLVGQSLVNSDESDGSPPADPLNDLGTWEITVEPLVDGEYDIRVEVEDQAGNISLLSDPLRITIDALQPQRPTVDLVGMDVVDPFPDVLVDPTTPIDPVFSDTGLSTMDDVTRGTDPQTPGGQGTTDVQLRISSEPGAGVAVKDGETILVTFTMPVEDFVFLTLTLDEDPHPISVEAFDAAGNRSDQSEELLVTIDVTPPDQPAAPNLLTSSDTGMFDDDNVTSKMSPAFNGVAEKNTLVRVMATNVATGTTQVVGQGLVHSDESDGLPPADALNGLGTWEVTVEPLSDGTYDITVELEDLAGNVSQVSDPLRVEIDTFAPNLPLLDLVEADDSGRHDDDNVTNDNTPQVTMTSEDPNAAQHTLFLDNLKFRIYDRFEESEEFLLYDSSLDAAVDAISVAADGFTSLQLVLERLPDQFIAITAGGNGIVQADGTLVDGIHNLKLEVEDRAGNISDDFLLDLLIDTVAPPVSIIGIDPSLTDTGVAGFPATFADRVTSDTATGFLGRAEADAIVRLFADATANGAIDTAGEFSLTVAVPPDGDDAFPDGQWLTAYLRDLNDPNAPDAFPLDGVREILVTAEDLAGNVNQVDDGAGDADQVLNIFLDTQGPRITDIDVNTPGNAYDLFDPKPSEDGPTPLVNSLVISVEDLPNRSNVDPNFLYDALWEQVAEQPGHYRLVGDHNGVISIASVDFVQNPDPALDGQPSTGTITLNFFESLPDDRFTLTISDSIVDPAGNRLDGETNALEPQETPLFPTGDGQPGGAFEGRFTVDSRPEIGVWAGGSVYVDTNGNFVFDPEGKNNDDTNEDIVYVLGFTTDNIFSGNFVAGAGDTADGFDKLAAYGRVGGRFRWLIDTDNDGVPNIMQIDPAGINGLPVAGNFDGDATNGDEVGIFTGSVWYLDTDHDFLVDTAINSTIRGLPIVGDFDGDGADDLATYNDPTDEFQFDLAASGFGGIDARFDFNFPGIREVPVAADMNRDGIDDVGLFVPDRGGATPRETGEWYFLLSDAVVGEGGVSGGVLDRITLDLQGTSMVPFTPEPFGNDLLAQFGDEFAVPLVGNFDPPVTPAGESTTNPIYQNSRNRADVDGDGEITPLDALQVINDLNRYGGRDLPAGWANAPGGYIDVNGDQGVSPLDALIVINVLNARSQVAAGAATVGATADVQAVVDLVMPLDPVASVPSLGSDRAADQGAEAPSTDDSSAAVAATVEDALLSDETRLVGRSRVGSDLDDLVGAIAQDVNQAWQADDGDDDLLAMSL